MRGKADYDVSVFVSGHVSVGESADEVSHICADLIGAAFSSDTKAMSEADEALRALMDRIERDAYARGRMAGLKSDPLGNHGTTFDVECDSEGWRSEEIIVDVSRPGIAVRRFRPGVVKLTFSDNDTYREFFILDGQGFGAAVLVAAKEGK